MYKFISLITLLSLTTGCATSTESILTGSVVGGATGTVLGHQQGGDSQARVTGAVVGTALGGLVGYLAHRNKKKKFQGKKDVKEAKAKLTPKSPFLTKPKVRMYWVPDRIEGSKFIEKHRVWEIQSGSSWSK